MLKRKAYDRIVEWKENSSAKALLVMGARQVGKTTTIRHFASTHYDTLAEINFYQNSRAVEVIDGAKDSRDLALRLSALSNVDISASKVLLFLDEIQECADILTFVKFLEDAVNCDIILSGSLLGLDSFPARSLPVGFLQTIEMFPMDFEEFCWADNVPCALLEEARAACIGHKAVPDFIHERLIDEFYRYLIIGGMPEAVQTFKESESLTKVRSTQRAIGDLYGYDISKYVPDRVEGRQIRMVFESIPAQLSSPNKRFKYTRLGKNLRFANLETAFDWLEHAGVALPQTRVTEPIFPLALSEDVASLKLFMNDVGLLSSQLGPDVDIDILSKRSSINFGCIFENAVAQEFRCHDFELHYYQNRKIGEIDFVLQDKLGEIILCEVKSGKDYRRHSALNNLLKVRNYSFAKACVLCEANYSEKDNVVYLPIYFAGFFNPYDSNKKTQTKTTSKD